MLLLVLQKETDMICLDQQRKKRSKIWESQQVTVATAELQVEKKAMKATRMMRKGRRRVKAMNLKMATRHRLLTTRKSQRRQKNPVLQIIKHLADPESNLPISHFLKMTVLAVTLINSNNLAVIVLLPEIPNILFDLLYRSCKL
jgi:hypothetical protein